MNKMNLNLQDYYLGIIKYNPNNCAANKLYLDEGPFIEDEETLETYISTGIPTVLIKEKDSFRDILLNRFRKELSYQLNNYNKKGIMLTHVEPFLNYYDDLSKYPMIYTESENPLIVQLQDFLPYLILPLYDGSEKIYLQDMEPFDNFYDCYINDFCLQDGSKEIQIEKEEQFLQNYYLGIIVCDSNYYKRPQSVRFTKGINFDPFEDLVLEDAMKIGVPTLLYKKGDLFYDKMWSRFENEISYSKDVFNHLGIKLIYTEPFLKRYKIENFIMQSILTQNIDEKTRAKIQNSLSFFAFKYPKTNHFEIEIIDDEPMQEMLREFHQKKGTPPYQKK